MILFIIKNLKIFANRTLADLKSNIDKITYPVILFYVNIEKLCTSIVLLFLN